MIDKLLKYIKENKNEDFKNAFNKSINSSHRVLLLETSINYDNQILFNFLKNVTSPNENEYAKIALDNLSYRKQFNPELCFYDKLTYKKANDLKKDHIKNICRLGDDSCFAFLNTHHLQIYKNLTWFIHYSFIFKNDKFLETIFNSQLSKEHTILCCFISLHHKQNDFLPIILENAFENNIHINIENEMPLIHKNIKNYLSNILKDGLNKQDIINILITEQIKAFEVILHEATADIKYSKKNNNNIKF